MKKITLIILLGLVSCNSDIKPKEIETKSIENEYLEAAVQNGDDSAYGSLLEEADVKNRPFEKLSLSLIMNFKHKNQRSYYEIFRNLIELHNDNTYNVKYFAKLDTANRDYAFYYLNQGAKKNFISCQMALEKILRNNYNGMGDLKKADSLYKVLESSSLGKFYKENRNTKKEIDKINE